MACSRQEAGYGKQSVEVLATTRHTRKAGIEGMQ